MPSTSPYDSPWRNSIVMRPSGRNLSENSTHFNTRSVSFAPRNSMTQESLPHDLDIMDGLMMTPLKTIPVPDEDPDQDDVVVKDYTYIGSYNWTKRDSPTIIVPGSPRLWQNRAPPYTIPPDTGVHFSDQNGYRMPQSVLLPLITAVNKQMEVKKKPPFDWSSVDFVTDRNGLRKLTRWVSGDISIRDFRIDLQMAGEKTVLMNRWEKRSREVFSGKTFGFSFEKASTEPAPGCKYSTGHHRIVTYDLNGLKMVVRFEVDACIPPPAKYPRKSVSSIDDLTDSLSAITIGPASRSGNLTVMEGGTEVSHTAVVELTTRSQTNMRNNGFDWKEAYPQLFFSQTAHHFLAIHIRGRFIDIQKRKLNSEELQNVAKDAQVELKKVRKALELIKEVVIEHGKKGRISLVCVQGKLKVYQRSSDESCLPQPALSLFEQS
ncbi:hypothetical protein M413DRAFT_443856 [Hebeloma cylindrosporum]|uniref:Geranylgeranyl pyrophosphate synthetase n=1 Tax=Hebeloma cylindrosporum TaxID=76867 RepID=A0A0C3CHE9_HEBCY|nr:hypothetical protein M413DRAFT_443856 [Hebeloma cylindrosporum h7]